MKTNRLIHIFLASGLLFAPVLVRAQQDQDVAEAARKAQQAKKTAPKAKITIDNDNLGSLTGTISVVGQAPAPSTDKSKTAVSATPGEKPAVVKDEAYWRAQFAQADKKLADDAHELDILQREYNLKQEQFYQDPMASLKEEYSRKDLNDTKTKIDDMTSVVGQDKQAISDLEDALRAAGGDPGWATPPPSQTPAPVGF
jgi:chromosome segregation ATPase